MQAATEEGIGQVEVFMNSVPLLGSLNREQKLKLVDAFNEEVYEGKWWRGLALTGLLFLWI